MLFHRNCIFSIERQKRFVKRGYPPHHDYNKPKNLKSGLNRPFFDAQGLTGFSRHAILHRYDEMTVEGEPEGSIQLI